MLCPVKVERLPSYNAGVSRRSAELFHDTISARPKKASVPATAATARFFIGIGANRLIALCAINPSEQLRIQVVAFEIFFDPLQKTTANDAVQNPMVQR